MAKVIALKKQMVAAEKEEENIPLAIKDYESIISKDPLAEKAYDRLMILYRKEKDHKNELRIIKAGIRSFESFYRSKKSRSKKIAAISKKLNASFGFIDKKGNAVYEPEPIARWKKRKMIVERKMGK